MRPVIGITCAWSEETWAKSEESGYYYAGKPYIKAIYENGGIPLLIPPELAENNIDQDVEGILRKLDGIVFSGGGDVKKFLPHDHPTLQSQQPKRYYFEKKLMFGAWERDIPVLGICRGHQMIAEVFGGTLFEDNIKGHKQDIPGNQIWHETMVEKDSYIYKIIGKENWSTNSYHIQAVDIVPYGFKASIHSKDGIIEGIEALNKNFFIGLQFHPEDLLPDDENSRLIFQKLIREAQKKSSCESMFI
ncbi:peptidase C26 [Alkaliphilus metalliredigens QYMF]|uniref:Peptidase C26 n=1 Tax=Alkaliphilus metalliredigens (strain QYMF) TaxID=293826 RepID=A6TSF0_ALKMQ|nr:type 1 glutamine amidotransferase [Alkaliphilus metalliredigens]ABR49118.1 peptidase C26 [Alkaliphilus metalliredigens QYMF]